MMAVRAFVPHEGALRVEENVRIAVPLPRAFAAEHVHPTPTGLRERARLTASQAPRVGLISNPRSHRNRMAQMHGANPPGVLCAAPATRRLLHSSLAGFAEAGVDLLVVDGGDGTVRDVLTSAGEIWGAAMPRLAVVPSGKTNALALDLGLPADWTVADAIRQAASGCFAMRNPIEIVRVDGTAPIRRGFLLGAAAFVQATEIAQSTHKVGAFKGLAVGLALAGALGQTLFGRVDSTWRSGVAMRLLFSGDTRHVAGAAPAIDGARYLLLASTLDTMPIGLKPFGQPRAGLKTLVVDAPARRLPIAAPMLLAGSEAALLGALGYYRADAERLEASFASDYVLDGEQFAGGDLVIRRGAPLAFAVP